MTRAAVALLVLLLAAPAAHAQEASAPPAAAPPASAQEEAPPREAPKSDAPVKQTPPAEEPSLDFDLLEPSPSAEQARPLDPELERRIAQRRLMLRLHQGLGIAMATGLVATTVVGQLQFNDSFRGGGDERALLPWHRGLAIGTTAVFATTGLLGLLAPTPYEKKEAGWDTVTFHKLFMSLATAGMLAQVVLGIAARDRYGQVAEVDLATAHQVLGYVTLGAVSAGLFTLAW
jgi:hypothetical protein